MQKVREKDERLAEAPLIVRLMRRPELGALAGLILVIAFFATYADASMFTLAGVVTILSPASELGLLAIAAAMLMIGGEFDLSIGAMVALAGLILGVGVVVLQLPFALAFLLAVAVAAGLGFINGQIVIRTKLPSFIVTLAFLFVFRGVSLVGLKWATGGSTQLRGIADTAGSGLLQNLFARTTFRGVFAWLAGHGLVEKFPNGQPTVEGLPASVPWFVVFAIVATWVLLRTRYGNWIFAAGGDANAARNSGVPVARVKTSLFMLTAVSAAVVATLQVMSTGSTDALRGEQKEFEAVIAAVIGGCLLTGGYGSAIGAALGAIIFGMVSIGLTYTRFDSDWFKVFLGGMLLLAVLFNNAVRRKVTGER
jgi:simple sugar transport system permease protein